MSLFSERLREAMQHKGWTQAELANQAGLNRSSINHYLSGFYEPKRENLVLIASALQVEPEWLLGESKPSEEQLSEWDANSTSIMEETRLLDQMQKRYGKYVIRVVHDMETMNEAGQQAAQGLVSDLAEVPYYKKGHEDEK